VPSRIRLPALAYLLGRKRHLFILPLISEDSDRPRHRLMRPPRGVSDGARRLLEGRQGELRAALNKPTFPALSVGLTSNL
jgi:hypothetical protein